MLQKRRALDDRTFRAFYSLKAKPRKFTQIIKMAKLEKIEGDKLLKEHAKKRMSFLLNSLYPEMSAERKKEIINKFTERTGLLNLFHYILTGGGKAVYLLNFDEVKISKKYLNNQVELTNTLDHEAIHFLNDKLKHSFPEKIEEFIADGVSSSIAPDKVAHQEIERIKDFPHSDISFPLKNKQLGKTLSSVENLKGMWATSNTALMRSFPRSSIVLSMSTLLNKTSGLKVRNQFLRDTMEGKNPIFSFNRLMKGKDIQAIIEGKTVKIKKVS